MIRQRRQIANVEICRAPMRLLSISSATLIGPVVIPRVSGVIIPDSCQATETAEGTPYPPFSGTSVTYQSVDTPRRGASILAAGDRNVQGQERGDPGGHPRRRPAAD